MSKKNNDYFSYEARQARRARRLASFDGISSGKTKTGKLTTQNAGQHAVVMAREILEAFNLPVRPKLSYSGIKNAKVAQSSSKLEDGVVTVFAELKTPSNVIIGFDMPMEIRAGELMEPSVVIIGGAPRILAQSTFDDLVARSTIYEQTPVREMYAPPYSNSLAKELYGNRNMQKKVNTGMFSLGANKQILKDVIAGKSIESQQMAPAPKEYMPGRHPVTQPIPKLKGPLQYGQTFNDDSTKLEMPNTHIPSKQEMPVDEPMSGEPTKSLRNKPRLKAPAQYPWPSTGEQPASSHPGDVGVVPQMPAKSKMGSAEDYDADDKHEKPDHDRNHQDEDWLDPSERTTNDLHVGQEVTVKEALELKNRGGGTYDISKGTKCTIVRDHAGDNKSFVIRLEDGMEAIVERCFLAKTGQMATKYDPLWKIKTVFQKMEQADSNGEMTQELWMQMCNQAKQLGSQLGLGEDEILAMYSEFLSSGGKSVYGQYTPPPEDGMPTVERQKQDMKSNEPVSLVADMDFMAKVVSEVESMANQGISEIDAKSAVFHKYGPDVAAEIFG